MGRTVRTTRYDESGLQLSRSSTAPQASRTVACKPGEWATDLHQLTVNLT
ncbi:hypothetical protein IG631_17865 [Alternaria alternata]|nr:hypothetical protein IG631_17865 [Alternaria alternata]